MDPDEYIELRYKTEWFEHVSTADGAKFHDRNVRRWLKAWEEYNEKDRPLRVLAIYGSGRNIKGSCAREHSNSKLLLRTGFKVIEDQEGIEIEEVELRQYQVEYCNGCYSTSSVWCHAPCTCFPLDPMQDLYPKVLRADVLLMSTGVNQSMIASRLKAFIDRLISADGGIHVPAGGYRDKDFAWLRACQALEAAGDFSYSPRLAGKVCAYFVTSKDQENDLGGPEHEDHPDYATMLRESLWSCWHDYGCLHAEPWFALSAAKPHEPMMYDKATHSEDTAAHQRAREVVLAAVNLAREVRDNPQRFLPALDRIGRT